MEATDLSQALPIMFAFTVTLDKSPVVVTLTKFPSKRETLTDYPGASSCCDSICSFRRKLMQKAEGVACIIYLKLLWLVFFS